MTDRPNRNAVQWIGEAVPRDLRVGDLWNGALIVKVDDDGIVARLPMRLPSLGPLDYDDEDRKSSGETPI